MFINNNSEKSKKMNSLELLKLIAEKAKNYSKESQLSISRNSHFFN